jgi:hypothetical protein
MLKLTYPNSTSLFSGDLGMNPGSLNAVIASIKNTNATSAAATATNAQEMFLPRYGATKTK